MAEYREEPEIDFDKIAHDAAETVNNTIPRQEYTLRTRLAIVLAALVIIANSVIGVYNSLALRAEVTCNQQLATALNVVSDQNRSNSKTAFDALLSSTPLTLAQRATLKKNYDDAYETNNTQREALLKTTCSSGHATTPPTTVPSGTKTS